LEVARDGHEVAVSGIRRRALFVRLVVSANEVVPAGRLIEDLWDGAPPPGAAPTLQSHVSALRRLIGSDRIRFVDGGYKLSLNDGECDVGLSDELTEARRAEQSGELELALVLLERWLGRWRGGALADVAGAVWATGEVTRLEELRAGAVERWLGVRLGLGDHLTVVADAERAVSEFPLREGFWAELMLAQYRSGRQSDALRSFQRLRKVLDEELGIEPSAELRDLEEAMLLQKSELDWRPAAGTPRSAESKAFPSGTVTFLCTEIEGSTALMEQVGDEVFARLMQEHHRIVRETMATHAGAEVSADNAGFVVVFSSAGNALAMAREAQATLSSLNHIANVQVGIRIGLHTGPGRRVGDTYAGLAVQQASLVCQTAHGGQIVATQSTRAAAGGLTDGMWWQALGRHRLQGLSVPLELHQLCHPSLKVSFEPIRTLGAFTHLLPVQVSSFLGRVEELTLGAKLLAAHRLVSAVGPGGAGKTRVAYQLAEGLLTQFPDGVWVVELAPEVDPKRIPALLLNGLGLRDELNRTATETIVSYLQDRRALVVLDNCEHMVDGAASFAAELLHMCGQLRILVTSREALRVAGEVIWQLGPLQLPSAGETELGVIAGTDAVALFCERASAALAGFDLDVENASTVMTICRRLDGMPLAIELAASWVPTLPLNEIAERIEDSLDLLSKGYRQGTDRHASLRATLTWSHDLLPSTEQVLFRRLSVFAGGCTLGAAERVGSGDGLDVTEVLDALDGLVDKSLVSVSVDQAGQGRYWMLKTVQAYALEHLEAAGELPAYIDRHANFYSRLASECAPGNTTRATCDRLEADHPNLLAAIQYFAESVGSAEHGGLVLDLAQFWDLRSHWRLGQHEVRRYLARVDRNGEPEDSCLRYIALFATHMGDYPRARESYLDALAIARKVGDRREETMNLAGLGNIAWFVADYAESGANYQAALTIARELGDRRLEGKWLFNLAIVARGLSEYAEARSNYEMALVIAREVGDSHLEAATLGSLGVLASDLGEYRESLALHEKALGIFREIGDRYFEAGHIGNIGRVNLRLGDYSESRLRFEEALAIARELGDRQSEGCWIGSLGEVASQLGDFREAQLRCEEALAIAQEVGDRRSQRDWLGELGGIDCKLGHYTKSRARYGEALAIACEVGRPDDSLLGACAELLVELKRYDEATELLGAADAIVTQTQRHRSPSEQSRDEATLAACRSGQSKHASESAYQRGRASDWVSASARASEFLGQD
jgi:predicted ATPase/class 3 adenylate cyclase